MSNLKQINKERAKIQIKNADDLYELLLNLYNDLEEKISYYPKLEQSDLLKIKKDLNKLIETLTIEYTKITWDNVEELKEAHTIFMKNINKVLIKKIDIDKVLASAIKTYAKNPVWISPLIWKNSKLIEKEITRLIVQGASVWLSPQELWVSLQKYLLTKDKWANYKLWRVWRTELARIHHNITIEETTEINKENRWYMRILLQYTLWSAKEHWKQDIKNANKDIWYWKGIYTPSSCPTVPVHPNCVCYTTSILLDNKWKEITLDD